MGEGASLLSAPAIQPCVAKLLLFISERIDNLRSDSEGPRVPSCVGRAEENAMMNMKKIINVLAILKQQLVMM